MKYLLTAIFSFFYFTLFAQINTSRLYGSWVKCKATYKDGTFLPDDSPVKYTYIKYSFSKPNIFNISISYHDREKDLSFLIDNGDLTIKSPEGYVINSLRIESLGDTLVLLQRGQNGFDDPTCIKYYFVPETVYQNAINLKADDIRSVIGGDTIYRESPKIYANYKGESFQQYIYSGISESISMHNRTAHFVASFIVSKTGAADSLKILESVDPDFDKRFIKVFNRAKKDWTPAVFNGKFVNVQMMIELKYSTSATVIPSYLSAEKANTAYNNKNYDMAIYYYNKALDSDPSDKDNLFKRGMCLMFLGNMRGACDDWNKAKSLGSNAAIDAVVEKYCK
jgi:hypothetical protein